MDEATARQRLESLVAADQAPTLTIDEVDQLLDVARVPDLAGNSPANTATTPAWTAGTEVLPGTIRRGGTRYWRALNGGTTGSSEPGWPELGPATTDPYLPSFTPGQRSGLTLLDGSIVWEEFGTTWAPTFDLNAAAAEGWRIKAGKAAGGFDFAEDGQSFSRSQIVAHCRAMADTFKTGTAGTLQV